MAITQEDVTRIARLARLEIADNDEISRVQNELNRIFVLIEELQAVDTSSVEPMAHPLSALQPISLRLRDDQPLATSTEQERQRLMANAPAEHEGLFLVPTVIE
jgi:aspartyl-tRNA(Asn)/glutamyl-tRNA(Gln) amidotransferase subunit C